MGAPSPFLLLLVAGVGLGLTVPAGARDHRVPEVELRIAERSRALDTWSSGWTYRSGPHCVAEASDGVPDFEPAVEVSRRVARPTIVFHKRARPQAVGVTGYRRLDENGGPEGPGRNYRPRLTPRIRAGEIEAWVARPRIRVGDRLYLLLSAAWPDRSGCLPGEIEDSASWSFGLRRLAD